ncbi:hypothetical protein EW145_g993 [Phellinidium pouzarii]|uniref:Uncharacterized protein n=1 Tax=Phellinidium pouzarii TaxID=167371 RepID=A0A4V3XDS8_9AGAM|nr:hypothetical protein EW145_g993 [Phellinidium pouzarii]
MEPVPFSSTPDLDFRASSSSSSESVSQSVRTPSEDNFINILDHKLEAIVKKERECEDRLKIRWSGHVHSGEMSSKRNSRFNSHSLESATHTKPIFVLVIGHSQLDDYAFDRLHPFNEDKKIARILKVLFGIEAVFLLGIVIYINLYEQVGIESIAEGVTVCNTNRPSPPVWGPLSWAVTLTYGLILMILALYKASVIWKEAAGFSGLDLVKVLIQDQIIYFFMVLFCSAAQIVAGSPEISGVLSDTLNVMGSPSLLCILGSRLLIRLKKAGERSVNGGTSCVTPSTSNMQFA